MRPGGEIDAGAEALGQDARQVLGQAAASNMREAAQPFDPHRLEGAADIDPGRDEQGRAERSLCEGAGRIPAEAALGDDAAHQAEAVRMHARGSEPEQDVARRHAARQLAAALHRPHREAGEIEIAAGVHPRHLRGLAADQRRTGGGAALGDSGDHLARVVDVKPTGGEIIQEEQRLRPLAHQVVDAHRHEVDADRAELPGLDGDAQLGPDPVGGGDEHGILVAGRPEVEERAEATEPGHHARARGPLGGGPDALDQRVAGVDVDAGIGIGQSIAQFCHAILGASVWAPALPHAGGQGNTCLTRRRSLR